VYFGLFIRPQRKKKEKKTLLDLLEVPDKQVLNVINMSSSATDQTRAGIVEHAADK